MIEGIVGSLAPWTRWTNLSIHSFGADRRRSIWLPSVSVARSLHSLHSPLAWSYAAWYAVVLWNFIPRFPATADHSSEVNWVTLLEVRSGLKMYQIGSPKPRQTPEPPLPYMVDDRVTTFGPFGGPVHHGKEVSKSTGGVKQAHQVHINVVKPYICIVEQFQRCLSVLEHLGVVSGHAGRGPSLKSLLTPGQRNFAPTSLTEAFTPGYKRECKAAKTQQGHPTGTIRQGCVLGRPGWLGHDTPVFPSSVLLWWPGL